MYLLLALPPVFFLLMLIFGKSLSAPGYKGPQKINFDGTTFKNYNNIKAKGFFDVLKWIIRRDKGNWKYNNINTDCKPLPTEPGLSVYFVNHATFLIQMNGKNILTDPIWSERTSPFSFAGPHRMRPPGIPFENLPQIHYVLLSHNHYDHLDIPTVKKIVEKHDPVFIVPLGVDLFLRKKGLTKLKTLGWWDSLAIDHLKIDMVPSQHFSGRGLFDRDKTLWGGYMISNEKYKVYFIGDTGFNEKMFQDIKDKHPKIDLALVPIGAFKPEWFMSPIHVSPAQAIKIHKTLDIPKSIAMHYGTFPLADDAQDEPQEQLKIALEKQQVDPDEFVLLEEGVKFNL